MPASNGPFRFESYEARGGLTRYRILGPGRHPQSTETIYRVQIVGLTTASRIVRDLNQAYDLGYRQGARRQAR